jgi:hypothetical protein
MTLGQIPAVVDGVLRARRARVAELADEPSQGAT